MAVLKVMQELPNAHVRLLENKGENLMEALGAGEMDVVVGPSEMTSPNPLVRSEILYAEPIYMVARVGHPIFDLATIAWADVLRYPWALWAKGTPVRRAFDKALAEVGHAPPPNHVESNSATLTTTLLLHSDMIGVTSQRPALRYSRLKLLSLISLNLGVLGSISLYWREDALDRPAVGAAVNAIRQVVREFGSTG